MHAHTSSSKRNWTARGVDIRASYLRRVVPAGIGNKPLLKKDMILPFFFASIVERTKGVRRLDSCEPSIVRMQVASVLALNVSKERPLFANADY